MELNVSRRSGVLAARVYLRKKAEEEGRRGSIRAIVALLIGFFAAMLLLYGGL
jgi:hypothetical protein